MFIFAVLVVSITTTLTFVLGSQKRAESRKFAAPQVLSANTAPFLPNEEFEDKNVITFLLLGYGGAGHQGGFLSDVIQLVRFDFNTQTISFISIPRDLHVSLPDGTTGKINTAFSLGNSSDPIHSGAEIAKQMATTVTGIPVDAFISVDFNGFKRAIGGPLDGLTVQVSEELDDPWYPISGKELDPCGKSPEEIAELTNTLSGFELEKQFECRYEHIYYDVGEHHMEGGDALAYVRSRHGSAGGDFSRSRRQQDVLKAIRDKLFKLEALDDISYFFKELIAHTDTDLDIDTIATLAPKLATTKDMETKSITLSTDNVLQNSKSAQGAYIVIPKAGSNSWEATHQYIESQLQ